MISFIGTVDGDAQISRAFNRLAGIDDFRSVWPHVATEVYRILGEQFESEGAAGSSGKWAPLSPAYKRWKEIHFPDQPILRLTNALFESLTSFEGLDSIYRPEKDELTIGSKAPYALKHQKTRPIFAFTEDQKTRIQKSIQLGLIAFTRQAGFQVDERVA